MDSVPQRLERMYEGKAKIVYRTADPGLVIIQYKDEATAFNAKKRGRIPRKGIYNNRLTASLYRYLAARGVRTHFLTTLDERSQLAHKVRIVPLEVVVRNTVAGSLADRLGMAEGTPLQRSVVEFYYKRDDLGDPLVNGCHIEALQLASRELVNEIEQTALRVNELLLPMLSQAGLDLIDVKMEFGTKDDRLYLADEISPDTCRLWEVGTGRKLDKDRFRWDLGDVEAAYCEVLERVEQTLAGSTLQET